MPCVATVRSSLVQGEAGIGKSSLVTAPRATWMTEYACCWGGATTWPRRGFSTVPRLVGAVGPELAAARKIR